MRANKEASNKGHPDSNRSEAGERWRDQWDRGSPGTESRRSLTDSRRSEPSGRAGESNPG